MSKKKKNKREVKSLQRLKEVDKYLDHTYDSLQEEIENFQHRLYMSDQIARKKAKKYAKKHKGNINEKEINQIKKQVREDIVGDMESTSFLDRIYNALSEMAPIVMLLSRLVSSLICAILSMDVVQRNIKPDTLLKLDRVYRKAMAVNV